MLDFLVRRADGSRIARAAGVESEVELAFAGVHQRCAPLLDGLDRLPQPHADALRTAFGLAGASPPIGSSSGWRSSGAWPTRPRASRSCA